MSAIVTKREGVQKNCNFVDVICEWSRRVELSSSGGMCVCSPLRKLSDSNSPSWNAGNVALSLAREQRSLLQSRLIIPREHGWEK